MSVVEAVGSGDRRRALEALRGELAGAIDGGPSPRDLAALARQLVAVLAELDGLPVAREGSVVDDLRARRSVRLADATGT